MACASDVGYNRSVRLDNTYRSDNEICTGAIRLVIVIGTWWFAVGLMFVLTVTYSVNAIRSCSVWRLD